MLTNIPNVYWSNIFQVTFSLDGRFLATVGKVSEADPGAHAPKIWDPKTYRNVANPVGHTDLVLSIAFSPDSQTLASCSVDDSVKFWDTTTWEEIPHAWPQTHFSPF